MRGALPTLLAASLSCASPNVSPVPSTSATADSTELAEAPQQSAHTVSGPTSAQDRPGDLPAGSVVPRSVEAKPGAPAAFVLALHGYGGSGATFARHFRLSRLAEQRGFIYLAPDGAPDSRGNRFWNADPACCDFDQRGVDHVLTLGALLKQALAADRVDANRVYVLGYSNGGFMAHRLGCEVASVRGILSVAGAGVSDFSKCDHSPEVVIQVHGDADVAVPFEGGHVLSRSDVRAHPGALATVTSWATKKGCSAPPELEGTLDLEAGLPESETERMGFSCAENVTLLKVRGAGHSLATSEAAIDVLLGELLR